MKKQIFEVPMNKIKITLIWTGYLLALGFLIAWIFLDALHLLFFAVASALLSKSLETDKLKKEILK